MPTGIVEGLAAANTVVKVFEKAHKEGLLEKLVNVFRHKHRVLVLGSTGAGKTNFLKSLVELVPTAIEQMNRTEFAKEHSFSILKQPFRFVDTPGQRVHESRRKRAIREAMGAGIEGVINVVSYGYHEYRIGKSAAIGVDGLPNESFLKEHRQIEQDMLAEWTALLGDEHTIGWVLTVVTKADLWWHQKDEVLNHYTAGPYYAALGDVKKLSPVVKEYCSVLHKFYGAAPLSGVFDEEDRVRTKANLLRQLIAAIGKASIND